MLVLSRKPNESVKLFDAAGNMIANIVVMECHGSKIRLGIEADPGITVLRTELLTRPGRTSPSGEEVVPPARA
jgi:carbon storage regulator CsrA